MILKLVGSILNINDIYNHFIVSLGIRLKLCWKNREDIVLIIATQRSISDESSKKYDYYPLLHRIYSRKLAFKIKTTYFFKKSKPVAYSQNVAFSH